MATELQITELGVYGVPTSIGLLLFTEGVPLRSVLAQGHVVFLNNAVGHMNLLILNLLAAALVDKAERYMVRASLVTDKISVIDRETGQVVLTDIVTSLKSQSLAESLKAVQAQLDTGSLVQAVPVQVKEPTIVTAQGVINLLDVEISNGA